MAERAYQRPNETPGTYRYWRLEFYDFLCLCRTETDPVRLAAAMGTMLATAAKTDGSPLEEYQLSYEWEACVSVYQRRSEELLLGAA